MKINDKFYVLQNNTNPVKFLGSGENGKGFMAVDTINEAFHFANKNVANVMLDEYNHETLHTVVPDFHAVVVNVTYEF